MSIGTFQPTATGWLMCIAAIWCAIGSAGSVAAAQPCGTVERPCDIDRGSGGRYYARPPAGWDGTKPLGVLLFFHGYQSSGAAFIENVSLQKAAARGRYLLVAADGLQGTWSHTGSPSQRRNEVEYVRNLIDDLTTRFPIDRADMWVAGFSQGGSMTWEVACFLGSTFKAYVPIAGAFWQPLPKSCPGGPVNILHIHGTADSTVPMLGRSIGPYRQGEVMKAWTIAKAMDRCAIDPQVTQTRGPFACEEWTACDTGTRLHMCLHKGGHSMPPGWADLAYDFLGAIQK